MSVEGITSKPSAPLSRPKAGVESRADRAADVAGTRVQAPDGAVVAAEPLGSADEVVGIDPKVAALVQDNLTAQDALALAAGLTQALANTTGAIANANPGATADETSA